MYGLREASVSRAIRSFVDVAMKFLPNEDALNSGTTPNQIEGYWKDIWNNNRQENAIEDRDIYSQVQISSSRELNTLLAKIFDLNLKLKKY